MTQQLTKRELNNIEQTFRYLILFKKLDQLMGRRVYQEKYFR